MPYLVRVGLIPGNASKVGARGYTLRRSGSKVVGKWGAIAITRTRPRIFYWAGPGLPQRRIYRFSSDKLAREFAMSLKREKLRHEPGHDRHNYTILPAGQIIRRFSARLVSLS